MWDAATGSVWSHLDGNALEGDLAGERLTILPLQTTTWSAWVAEHPETTVPVMDTRYTYRRGSIGGARLGGTFLDTLPELDTRLPSNAFVIGVLAGDEAWAFPLERVPAALSDIRQRMVPTKRLLVVAGSTPQRSPGSANASGW